MDMNNITNKEIQFNIMMALMKIEGHLSDMVTAHEECCYDTMIDLDWSQGFYSKEVNDNDTSGINK